MRNSGIPDDRNLMEIYCISVNPELRVNLTEILTEILNVNSQAANKIIMRTIVDYIC